MKKSILKAVLLSLTICAVLPAVAALAQTNGGDVQQINAHKDKPVEPSGP